MDFITVNQAAQKWGYSVETIRKWCREEKISVIICAEKKNGHWIIPANAECPKKIKKKQ